MELERAFADAKLFGYDFVELWGGRPHAFVFDLLKGGLKKMETLIEKYSMPVKVFTPEHNAYPYNYMLGDLNQWVDCMDYFSACAQVTQKLGAEYMLVSIGHGVVDAPAENAKRLLRSMEALVRIAEAEDVTIVLETLTKFESNVCTSLSELDTLLKRIDSPKLCAALDMVAPFTCGEDPAEYARVLGDKLRHVHLVDSDGISDTHLMPGEGKIDLKAVLSELRANGYGGGATIELVTHYIDEPSRYAELAIKKARELL